MTARVARDFTWCASGTEVSFHRGEVITSEDPRITPELLAWAERHDLVWVIGRSVQRAPMTKGA